MKYQHASPHSTQLFIRNAQLFDGNYVDVRINSGRIADLASSLVVGDGEYIIDAGGALLLPGLHDHHLHLFATAAARNSIVCGPPHIINEDDLRYTLQQAVTQGEGWLRGAGFHDSVCATLNRDWLDQICPLRPLRIQHRSGMMWVLNSCAIDHVQLPDEAWPAGAERDNNGRLTGRCYNLDQWLGEHLPRTGWPSLAALSADLARVGITAVTDTGVNNGEAEWLALSAAIERGELQQRLLVMGTEALVGLSSPYPQRLSVGPLKLYLREAQLPELDHFAERIAAAHRQLRAVAIHCVTRVELYFALAAFEQAGVLRGDRIEHASVTDDYALATLAELGLTVVSQPQFIAERGDQYRRDVDVDDIPLLYRARSFINHGIAYSGSSDAPYGGIDPWAAMSAAMQRQTATNVVMGEEEMLSAEQALQLFSGEPHAPGRGLRSLAVGQQADLCLLNVPRQLLEKQLLGAQLLEKQLLEKQLRENKLLEKNPRAAYVRMTVCDGKIIYLSDSAEKLQDKYVEST